MIFPPLEFPASTITAVKSYKVYDPGQALLKHSERGVAVSRNGSFWLFLLNNLHSK
jgi:hypothetical protein